MPKLATQKTDTAFRNAKPKASPYLIADGNGLYLKVTTDGVKRWIFRYTFRASKKTIALPNNRYCMKSEPWRGSLVWSGGMNRPGFGLMGSPGELASTSTACPPASPV